MSSQSSARALHPDLECVLFSEAEIAAAIRSLAEQIARDHAGEDVLLLGILKGAVHVLSDLARVLDQIQPGTRISLGLLFEERRRRSDDIFFLYEDRAYTAADFNERIDNVVDFEV